MEDKKRKYNSSQQQAGASRPRYNNQQGPQSRPAYQSGNQGQQQNVRYSNQSQQTSQRYNNNQVQRPASQAPRQNAPAPSGSRQNSNTVPMKPNVNPAPTGNTCFKCATPRSRRRRRFSYESSLSKFSSTLANPPNTPAAAPTASPVPIPILFFFFPPAPTAPVPYPAVAASSPPFRLPALTRPPPLQTLPFATAPTLPFATAPPTKPSCAVQGAPTWTPEP
ncbi:lysine-rich arabinogalactan protein 18-like [Sorghum bicolor]|uniref:lysine-rich arabinogalactan protein 18-like n=1 Tax=Sorghum bicolor TaxID=4558 RepID=UPI000B426246|nr:lysine-rich arabinogalactan protein 18-like [Sorghum bicolor]|eukprot:XP_021307915.1 lysine-rich arabinogalactan protein 18-like [Sorghum bicolor]